MVKLVRFGSWLSKREVVLSFSSLLIRKLGLSVVCNCITVNIMAQVLQPLFILLLLVITLICHPKGVKSLEYADYNSIVDIKKFSESGLY